MVSVTSKKLTHNWPLPVKKSNFELKVLYFKSLYPSARLVENFGHTFLIDESKYVFIAFKGRRATNPVVTMSFQSVECLNDYYHSYVRRILREVETKRLRRIRAEKKNEKEIQPGKIFYTACGCDQIKIEFFQIVAVKGRSVTIQKIEQLRTYNSVDHGLTRGIKDSFIEAPVHLRIGTHGIRIDAVQYLNYWDKKAVYWCSYA
ncbi:hypothetical protein GCM10007423_63850 [Dyadobacter endophyticus]|uniref:Uncharacterized protein n=1 Tax=Dyadobacter endophyticus TaxID=1749036 RepID=A0ABQ1ZD64_9BACT|nr:hypothetical protein [Dyadobacter endophyticus]GGH55857.1 hypothetical protein GCM10007423_63850 [Dyadobacter endophyticus]